MKTVLIACAAACFFALPAVAAIQEIEFPESSPLITFSLPGSWKTHEQSGVFQAAASSSLDTMMTVKPLEATRKEGSQAIAEIKDTLAKTYGENIEYDKLEEGGTADLGLYVLNATAKVHSANEGDVTCYINSIIVSQPDTTELILVQFLSTKVGADENGETMAAIIESIKKAK